MHIVFLYPFKGFDALADWVVTMSRHTKHKISLVSSPYLLPECDAVFLLTQHEVYPKARIDEDIQLLTSRGVKFGVIHNHDNPAVPTPGRYPSFCWTRAAYSKLARYEPKLIRQPCLVPVHHTPCDKINIATFGYIEPKKRTLQMARWAAGLNLPFTAVAPESLAEQYSTYISLVTAVGAKCIIRPWRTRVESLHTYFDDVSHFLFVLGPSKAGRGGSPTSPHYATYFGKPVLVVDDEDTLAADGIAVFSKLVDITLDAIKASKIASVQMTVDSYLDTLLSEVHA